MVYRVNLVKECAKCSTDPRHRQELWAGIIGTALLLEYAGLQRKRYPHTLSHVVRYMFKTDTRAGNILFKVAWAALTVWFVPHVTKGVNTQ